MDIIKLGMPKCKLTSKQIAKLIGLYKDSNIKMKKLCEIFGVSDDTIVRAMKKEGILMRKTIGFCGKKNSNWKGGESSHYAKNVAVRHFKKNECLVCGYKVSTDVHHWDKNKYNNKKDNLILLCPNHHREVHLGLLSKRSFLDKK
jgi:hypothetical protein